MKKILNKNIKLFNDNFLSTNDVLLKPSTGIVESRKEINLDETFLFSSPMDTVTGKDLILAMLKTNQCPVSCRFNSYSERATELISFHKNKNYWFSVGTSKKDYDFLNAWSQDYPEAKINIAVDVAHGDTIHLHKIYERYSKQDWCANLMSGTVATPESAKNCYDHGCTHIRVGIGPGSACSTRIVTGCGLPNLSAVHNIWLNFYDLGIEYEVKIIADGGIKTTGDIAKYLAAGADAVMIGNLLSKTQESAGWKVSTYYYYLSLFLPRYSKYIYYKRYRGQASASFQLAKRGQISGTPEGVEGPKQYPQYSYLEFYNSTVNALRSSLSYLGGNDFQYFSPENIEFILITQNSLIESKPHLLT